MNQPAYTGRLIAIGDIHGHAQALSRLLESLAPQKTDTIVTLGDYINRGPDSRQVIEQLLELKSCCQLICILGNHDQMMLEARTNTYSLERFRDMGLETLRSYGGSLTYVPENHWDFLVSCRNIFENEKFVFTHANYCWYSNLTEQPASLLRWMSLTESPPEAHLNGKVFILGHTPGAIRDEGFYRCIDTGCGFDGLLTAMEVNTGQIWQVPQ